MSNDPFSLVYDGLWTLVDRNRELQKIISVRNTIRYKEEGSSKTEISDADLPELALVSSGGVFNEGGTSTTRRITRNYSWILTTGSMIIDRVYNKISFELYRSMMDYECVLCSLSWCDCKFVTNCRLINSEEGTRMEDQNRNIAGWAALWTCEVDFEFLTQNLRIKA